ncbi:membrane protein insertion efficiency factor YidD [Oxalobacteraceae bacterium R-40]|uniref:Putative membrane protein insertion efficiency factor n=1 Tax=Keguizhuia sedimenti TaxID=3064264 RepID=A0ABU1BMZ7_9BURK|nr:membrane protein insertion efficiency factor YidD [Oxalobacteraceae bacterium R-40]
MKTVLLLLLRGYQLCISPFIGQNCRFYPSCSEYAAEAIRLHGSGKGCVLTAKRLCKCHPWHPGGADPVPQKPAQASHATGERHS